MINYVKINGVNSNTINGLGINELPPITKPPLRVLQEEIDGRDGDITTDLGYGAYDKTITIGLFGTGYDINSIISFFNGEGTIVFSNEPDKYYKYKIVNQIDYVALQKFKSASITFHCQPFKYLTEETPLEIEYDYIEQSNVESASITQTETAPMKLTLKGNTSQTGTPTPDSPIPINVVSGDNEVVVSATRNIAEMNDMPQTTQNGITYKVENNVLYLNGTTTSSLFINDILKVLGKMSGYYTLQYRATNIPNGRLAGGLKNASSTIIIEREVRNGYYLTQDINDTMTNSYVYIANGTTITNGTIEIEISKGNDVPTFETYQGSQTYPIYLGVENLLDISDITTGSFITNNGDSITLNGASSGGISYTLTTPIILKANQPYTLSITNSSSSYSNATFILRNGTTNKMAIALNQTDTHYTPTSDTTIDTLRIYSGDYTFNNFTFSVQLEEGSKANHFTPYGETPIELCKIGDYQDYFTKNTGKNKFDLGDITSGGILTKNETGITLTRTQDSRFSSWYNMTNSLPAGSYKVVCERSGNYNDTPGIQLRYNGGTEKNIGFYGNNANFTLDSEVNQIRFYLGGSTTVGYYLTANKLMFLKSDETNTSYEPFGNGLLCKYNAIGKVVYVGAENEGWELNQSKQYCSQYVGPTIIDAVNSTDYTQKSYTNYFKFTQGNPDDTTTNAYYWKFQRKLVIVIQNTNASTVAELKTWLSSHNVEFYYIVETPYLTLVPDTLKSQLDNIQNAMSYEGTTNINQVNNDKPFLMDLKIMKEGTNEVVINNIGNYYAKPTIALEGTGITDIYLNDTEILQVDLSDTNKITIDTANMEAYDSTTNLLANRKVVGSYNSMTLPSGNTTMKITGQLTSATITSYTRWL